MIYSFQSGSYSSYMEKSLLDARFQNATIEDITYLDMALLGYKVETKNTPSGPIHLAAIFNDKCEIKPDSENDGYKVCNSEIIIWNKRTDAFDVNLTKENFQLDITKDIKDGSFSMEYSSDYDIVNQSVYNSSCGDPANASCYNLALKINFDNWQALSQGFYTIQPNKTVAVRLNFEMSQYDSASYNLTYIPADFTLDPEIDSCGTLGTANAVYTLNQSIIDNAGPCMLINANNITFNLNGYQIEGTRVAGAGVYGSNGINDTKVINGSINNFSIGVIVPSNGKSWTVTEVEINSWYDNDFAPHARGILLNGNNEYCVINDTLISAKSTNAIIVGTAIGIYDASGHSSNNITNVRFQDMVSDSTTCQAIQVNGANTYSKVYDSNLTLVGTNCVGGTADINVVIGQIDVVNSTYLTSVVNLGTRLKRFWYYQAYVNDTAGNPIAGINVSDTWNNGTVAWIVPTNASGYIERQLWTEFIENSTIKQYYNPHTLYATNITDEATNSLNVTVEKNKLNDVLTLQFIYPNADLCEPPFQLLDSFGGGDKGVDGGMFDESPIMLNDYGNNPLKADLINCTSWTGGSTIKRSYTCQGGFECLRNDTFGVCREWNCTDWVSSAVDRTIDYCSGEWECTDKQDDYCYYWNCSEWTQAPADSDMYCTGVTECTEYSGGECISYNCSEWTAEAGGNKLDRHCVGSYDCTVWDEDSCQDWNCTSWSSGETTQKDYYPISWSCTEWYGDRCDKWTPQSWTAGATNENDYYCIGGWDCNLWNYTSEQCMNWTCLNYIIGSGSDVDMYCSGTFNVSRLQDFDDPPLWSNNQSTIVATYSPTTLSTFNITWTDDVAVKTVFFESNYTGTSVNYTMNNIGGNIYNYSSILPAGTYYWKSHANDTTGQFNSTDKWAFTIAKASSILNLTLNGTESNINLDDGDTIDLNCSTISGDATTTLELYNNGTLINTGTSPLGNTTTFSGVGTFNITCYYTSSQNYTGSYKSYTVTTKDITAPNITAVAYYNKTGITDGDVVRGENLTINVTVTDLQIDKVWVVVWEGALAASNVLFQGFLNLITNYYQIEIETNLSYPLGEVNYTIYANDTEGNEANFSSNFTAVDLDFNPDVYGLTEAPPDPATYNSIVYYEFNATVTDDVQLDYVSIEFNGVNYTATNMTANVYNFTIYDIGAGTYPYRWFANDSIGNINNTENGTYTVDKATPIINLTLNETQGNVTIGNGSTIWLNCSILFGGGGPNLLLYNEGNLINNGSIVIGNLTTFSGLGAYNITCIYAESQNFTSTLDTYYVNVVDVKAPNITDVTYINESFDVGGIIERGDNITINATVTDDGGGVDKVWIKVWEGALAASNVLFQGFFNLVAGIYQITIETNSSYATGEVNYTIYANDTYANEVNTSSNFTVQDTVPPLIEFVAPSTGSGTYPRDFIIANVTADGDFDLENVTVYLYNTTDLINSTTSTTSPLFLNFTELDSGTYYMNATAFDTAGNSNSTETSTIILDTTIPLYTNITEFPTDPATYAPSQFYQFNSTWTGPTIDIVIINFDGTNYTIPLATGNVYAFNITDLGVGTYNYQWFANGTNGFTNETSVLTYTIDKATPTINLTLNGTSGSVQAVPIATINITLANIIGDDNAVLQTFLDGGLFDRKLNEGTDVISNQTIFNIDGIYNITGFYQATDNYSTFSTTYYVTVASNATGPTEVEVLHIFPDKDKMPFIKLEEFLDFR